MLIGEGNRWGTWRYLRRARIVIKDGEVFGREISCHPCGFSYPGASWWALPRVAMCSVAVPATGPVRCRERSFPLPSFRL